MSTPWSFWLTRLESWLARPGRRRRPGRSPRSLSRCEALEPRVTPAFFSPTIFAGGVRVASADVNGDLFNDIVAAAGPGGGPHVKVYSGKDGSVIRSFFAYDAGFHGGVYVATGDVNG